MITCVFSSSSHRPFAPMPTRRYTSLPFESQRRLITVPEEEGSADERLTSPEELLGFPVHSIDADDEFCDDFPPPPPEECAVQEKT